ncbi:hypothetical protein [Streptomyces sp. AB3(2024)]|uniref:hypothetical protein n=1 Tax=Streptomyces sp. AB3(2024) TaxID=3317321 RepID=UPI0035A299BC
MDGRWLLGDPGRPGGGAWVEFREDGMRAHARDSSTELIPWSRIMLGMGVVIGARYPGRSETVTLLGMAAGLPGPLRGRRGGYLHMTVRHPYEDRQIFFDRHPQWYPLAEVTFLEALLTHLVAEGETRRLADTAWLDRVVTRLPPLKLMTSRAALRELLSRAVEEGAG